MTLTVFGTSLGLHSSIAAARPWGAGFERAVCSGGSKVYTCGIISQVGRNIPSFASRTTSPVCTVTGACYVLPRAEPIIIYAVDHAADCGV